jgi:hypothetical protein
MDKPRYEWVHTDRDEWPYDIYDHYESRVVARCEKPSDAHFLHMLLTMAERITEPPHI